MKINGVYSFWLFDNKTKDFYIVKGSQEEGVRAYVLGERMNIEKVESYIHMKIEKTDKAITKGIKRIVKNGTVFRGEI